MAEFPEFSYLMPTEIRFGAGCFNELPKWCGHLGERPFVVTGKRSARAQGLLDRLQARLPGAVFYDKVDENPTTVQCDAASAVCREHRCDMVLAIGGGSPMDVAKAVAGLALNDGPCAKFVGSDLFARGALPIIAVPTTAGTGSEVTPYSVLVDTSENQKRTIKGRALFPRVALLDPELTTSLPAAITADTGLDALSQAMEGLVSKKSTALGNILALEACRLVSQWLPRAVHEPSNLEARGNMLVADVVGMRDRSERHDAGSWHGVLLHAALRGTARTCQRTAVGARLSPQRGLLTRNGGVHSGSPGLSGSARRGGRQRDAGAACPVRDVWRFERRTRRRRG